MLATVVSLRTAPGVLASKTARIRSVRLTAARTPGPAAHRLADDDGLVHVRRVHDRRQVRLEVGGTLLLWRTDRAREAAVIEDGDPVRVRERRHLLPPACGIAAGAVGEDQVRSCLSLGETVGFVVDVDRTVFGVRHPQHAPRKASAPIIALRVNAAPGRILDRLRMRTRTSAHLRCKRNASVAVYGLL